MTRVTKSILKSKSKLSNITRRKRGDSHYLNGGTPPLDNIDPPFVK